MNPYHKIQSIFKRDSKGKILYGQFTLKEFEYLAHNDWDWTEKVDGTNIRVIYDGNGVEFRGRTDNAQLPSPLVKRLQEHFPVEKFHEKFQNTPTTLYGEGYGPKIQKVGHLYRPDQDFVLFDVRIGDFWLQRYDVKAVAESLDIDVVPVVGHGSLFAAIQFVEQSPKSVWGDFTAEGIIARPPHELFMRNGDRIITKIKVKDFA